MEKFLIHAPNKKIIARKRNNLFYYSSIDKEASSYHETYLRKDSAELVTLAKREYSVRRLEDAKKELHLVDKYLQILVQEPTADRYLRTHEGIASIIAPLLKSDDSKIQEWLDAEYQRNPYNPDGLIYPTILPGLKTRSKSESDILGRLVHYKVPFHYEEGVVANGRMLYPDITCMSVSTKKIYYWEHLGSMDNIKYAQANFSKIPELYNAGLTPWQNLIITTETSDSPLDINFVDYLIEYYLL